MQAIEAATGAPTNGQLARWQKSTPLLDVASPALQHLVEARGWKSLPRHERIGAVYTFVRDEIAFGYNTSDNLPASHVLADGIGQCNAKSTLLMALLRSVGVPCRFHGFTIDKALQKGAVTGIAFWLAPRNVSEAGQTEAIESSPMRRRLFIALLFLVLPFQYIWAAAAPYCAHETRSEASKHFGHHEHKHQGTNLSESAADTGGDASSAPHADCESCHLGSGASLPSHIAAVAEAPRDGIGDYQPPFYRSHTPRGPEYPDIAELTPAARFGGGVVSGVPSST